MKLCQDGRKRWLQYGENRVEALARRLIQKGLYRCEKCEMETSHPEVDHIVPLGPRPRIPHAFGEWLEKMFYRQCEVLCKLCHKEKTDAEREKRKAKNSSI